MPKIDIASLGQVLDTTWGRTSTPRVASYSVKFSLHGDLLTASYAAIVNFGTANEMAIEKEKYFNESNEVIKAVMKNVASSYKELTGHTLSFKEQATNDSVEIKNFNVHNARRTAYYRRKTVFEIA